MRQTVVYCDRCGSLVSAPKEVTVDWLVYDICPDCEESMVGPLKGKGRSCTSEGGGPKLVSNQ